MINGIWKLSVLQRNFSTFLPFSPSQPHLSFTELGFPLTCILSESCLVFFVHATLKFSGTGSQGWYLSTTVSHPLFGLFVCFSCLVLKF